MYKYNIHIFMIIYKYYYIYVHIYIIFQNIQLRLTLAEYQSEGKTPAIGHIFVGPHCSGKQLSHWNQMISAPRKPIAMWHPLKKRDG